MAFSLSLALFLKSNRARRQELVGKFRELSSVFFLTLALIALDILYVEQID